MPRNRIISNCEALFVGPTPATGYHFLDMASFGTATSTQIYGPSPTVFGNGNTGVNLVNQLHRLQSINFSFNIPRQDIFQYGDLGALSRENTTPPTVNLDFSYILGSFINEKYLGFQLNTLTAASSAQNVSALLPMINETQDTKNYFIKTTPVAIGDVNNSAISVPYSGEVIGIGNASITQYTSEGAVGDFPKVSVSVEGLNMKFDKITSWDKQHPQVDTGTQVIPAIDPTNGNTFNSIFYSIPHGNSNPTGTLTTVNAFKQGDIRFNLLNYSEGGAAISDVKIQSYSLNIPMSRTDINKLGTKYAYSKNINLPITATLSINAIVGDLTTGNLTEIVNNNSKYNCSILLQPQSVTTNPANFTYPQYFISGATLDGHSYSSSIGSNKSVTMNFSIPLGANSTIIMSGDYTQSF